jgi:osmotically-inducible protein OsmY
VQKTNHLFRVLLSALLFAGIFGCAGHGNERRTTGEYVDDSWITSKVKTAFVKDRTLKTSDITVETSGGVVELSGWVSDPGDVSHAAEVASNVRGVTSVRNDVQVKY